MVMLGWNKAIDQMVRIGRLIRRNDRVMRTASAFEVYGDWKDGRPLKDTEEAG